jgi:PST family polysaccharide transporter
VDKHLVGGIAWTAAAKWSNQILSWAFMLIVARLLSPSDFGLVGIAAIYFDLATNFSEFGLGSAIVTLRDLSGEQVRGLNTFSLLASLVGFVFSCGAAIPLGVFFRSPQLPPVVVAMSASFLISGFQTVPKALLQKKFQFRLLSIIDAVQALAQTLAVLVLALRGFGHWALVIGILVAAMTRTVCLLAWCHPGFARPRFGAIKRAVTFSWHVVVSRMAWTTYTDADFIVAGRVLGTASLGAYTFAWNLANAPVDKISSVVTGVTPAFFSAVQTDHAALRRYLRTLTEGLSMITIPTTLGLALVASEFVPLALGRKWEGVVVPLQILACYASFRSITTLLGQVLTALGETRFVMWNTLAAFVLLPTAFVIGSRWGAAGIAWGWIVGYPLVALPLYRRTFREINMRVSEYFGAVRPSLDGSLAMAAFVLLLKWALPSTWPLLFRFGLEVLTGAVTYCILMLAFHRDRVLAFWYLIQKKGIPSPLIE